MKTALIFPPASFLINEKVNPPLGLGYLSAYLKAHGYSSVTIYHITDEIPKIEADVIGIGFTTPQYNSAVKILNELRTYNKKSLFVAGGVHATSCATECLKAGFDVVVAGEGEKALLNIVRECERGNKINQVIIEEEIHNIDEIPFPDYEGLRLNDYKFMFNNKNFASILTSRGCPMRCNYCASRVMWGKVRLHSVEYVNRHIDYLYDKYGVDAIMFQDDIFPVYQQRMKQITEHLKSKNMQYRCLARANNLDKITVGILKNTGCIEVGVGIESGNQKMLDMMNKAITVEQNRRAIINCKEVGMSIKAFVLLGTPGESKKSIEDTIKLLEETSPDDIDANILVLYPATEFYSNISRYDINQEVKEYDKMYMKGKIADYTPTISTSKITAGELEQYRKTIFNKFSKLAKK